MDYGLIPQRFVFLLIMSATQCSDKRRSLCFFVSRDSKHVSFHHLSSELACNVGSVWTKNSEHSKQETLRHSAQHITVGLLSHDHISLSSALVVFWLLVCSCMLITQSCSWCLVICQSQRHSQQVVNMIDISSNDRAIHSASNA